MRFGKNGPEMRPAATSSPNVSPRRREYARPSIVSPIATASAMWTMRAERMVSVALAVLPCSMSAAMSREPMKQNQNAESAPAAMRAERFFHPRPRA